MQSISQDSVLDKDITFEVLASLFHLPLSTAALQLGVCCTALKKKCRKNGISRWPYRTLQSIDKMISAIENAPQNERASIELEYLKSKRDVIMRKPSATAKSAATAAATKTIKKPSQAKFAPSVVNRQMLAQANPLDILQEAAKYSEYSAPLQAPQKRATQAHPLPQQQQGQQGQQALAPMPIGLSRTDHTKFIPMSNSRIGNQSHQQGQPPFIMPSPPVDIKTGQKMGSRYVMVPSLSPPGYGASPPQLAPESSFTMHQGQQPQQAHPAHHSQAHHPQSQAPQQYGAYPSRMGYSSYPQSAPQHLQQVSRAAQPSQLPMGPQVSKGVASSFAAYDGARRAAELPYAPPVHRSPSPPGSSPPHNPSPLPNQGWNFELPQLRIPESASGNMLPKLRTLEPSSFPMSNQSTPLTMA